MLRKVRRFRHKTMQRAELKYLKAKNYVRSLVLNEDGEYIEMAFRILIACVIGALLLGAFYLLFSGTVVPKTNDKVNSGFDYAG